LTNLTVLLYDKFQILALLEFIDWLQWLMS